jgi:nitrogen fixation-related uncharacterized protein
MSGGARLLIFWIGAAVVIAVVLFVWGWRNGQFKNIEEAKYRMLDDREPEPWPGRENGGSGSGGSEERDAADAATGSEVADAAATASVRDGGHER